MAEFDPQETVTVKYNGRVYKIRKYLTIGEEIARKGRRSQICGGQYGAMNTSADVDERSVAMMADIITELDARIMEGPKSWNGAEVETEDGKLIELWKEVAQSLGRFPQGLEDNGQGNPPAEGHDEGRGERKLKPAVDEKVVP